MAYDHHSQFHPKDFTVVEPFHFRVYSIEYERIHSFKMNRKISSPQAPSLGWIVLAALVSFTFFPLGDCADVFTRFFVGLTPQLGGDCSNYPVADMYDEALLMAQAAIDAINNYGSDPVVRAQLQTFFGIAPNDAGDAVSPAQANQLANVQGLFSFRRKEFVCVMELTDFFSGRASRLVSSRHYRSIQYLQHNQQPALHFLR